MKWFWNDFEMNIMKWLKIIEDAHLSDKYIHMMMTKT